MRTTHIWLGFLDMSLLLFGRCAIRLLLFPVFVFGRFCWSGFAFDEDIIGQIDTVLISRERQRLCSLTYLRVCTTRQNIFSLSKFLLLSLFSIMCLKVVTGLDMSNVLASTGSVSIVVVFQNVKITYTFG